MNTKEKVEIGLRMKEFAQKNFGTIDALAKLLDMEPTNLRTNYIKGKSVPGGAILKRMALLGCDIHWLLTSEYYSAVMQQVREREKRLKEELYKKEKILSLVAENMIEYKKKKE